MVTLKWSLVFDKMTSLLQGCAVTMEISVLTLIFGTILGVVLALMRDSHIKVVSRLAQMYIWIWRGTPLMVQAFLIYFGLPNLGITFSAMTAGVLSMSLNTGAYIAEIVRSVHHYPSLADVLPIVKKNSFNRDAYPRFRQHRSKKLYTLSLDLKSALGSKMTTS